jgi:hypothetical protein
VIDCLEVSQLLKILSWDFMTNTDSNQLIYSYNFIKVFYLFPSYVLVNIKELEFNNIGFDFSIADKANCN